MRKNSFILFEPICRGSRLQILANIISAIRSVSERKIIIITRSDYRNSHFDEVMGPLINKVEVVAAKTDLGGEWIKSLNRREFSACLDSLLHLTYSGGHDVIFMALDDYLIAFAQQALNIRWRLRNNTIWIMKYRVEYLFSLPFYSLRYLALNLVTRWAIEITRARFVCFDERLEGGYLGGHAVAVIPDPWFGGFNSRHRVEGRKVYHFSPEDFIILTLGRQDRRKGIQIIINTANELMEIPNSILFVVGKIDKLFLPEFTKLKNKLGERIKHVDQFVAEEQLPFIFASADVFLMPYASDFTATSGTLARAAASGVPVVTGSHGLVGHRVQEIGLGETFLIDDPAGFIDSIERVRNYSIEKRGLVLAALKQYAENTMLSQFEYKVGMLLNDKK